MLNELSCNNIYHCVLAMFALYNRKLTRAAKVYLLTPHSGLSNMVWQSP